MSGDREDLPASGSETDADLTPEFTYDEWTRDILEDLGDIDPPLRSDGWRSMNDLLGMAKGLSEIQIRDRLEKKLRDGSYEKVVYKKMVYYRPKR